MFWSTLANSLICRSFVVTQALGPEWFGQSMCKCKLIQSIRIKVYVVEIHILLCCMNDEWCMMFSMFLWWRINKKRIIINVCVRSTLRQFMWVGNVDYKSQKSFFINWKLLNMFTFNWMLSNMYTQHNMNVSIEQINCLSSPEFCAHVSNFQVSLLECFKIKRAFVFVKCFFGYKRIGKWVFYFSWLFSRLFLIKHMLCVCFVCNYFMFVLSF